MNMVHTFAICAYGESPYLEECIQSLFKSENRKQNSDCHIHPEQPDPGDGREVRYSHFVNYLEKGLAGDWNFAYNCANTPLVTLAHQDDRYYENYTEDILAAAKSAVILLFYLQTITNLETARQ